MDATPIAWEFSHDEKQDMRETQKDARRPVCRKDPAFRSFRTFSITQRGTV